MKILTAQRLIQNQQEPLPPTPNCFRKHSVISERDREIINRISTPTRSRTIPLRSKVLLFIANCSRCQKKPANLQNLQTKRHTLLNIEPFQNIKRQILVLLKSSDITRAHKDFDDVWMQIYRNVKFSFVLNYINDPQRKDIPVRSLNSDEIESVVEANMDFVKQML